MPTYTFRKPQISDAQMILDWRTRPEVTRYMYTDVAYDLDKQKVWLEKCSEREDYRHYLVCSDDRPVGYVCFHDIDWQNKCCSNGSYLGDLSERTKIGALWTWYIHDYVFYELKMHKMVTTFMSGNDRVVKGQEVNGLRHVGIYRDHIYKYERYHDVYVFELLKEDWDRFPRRPFTVEETLAAFEPW